MSDQGDFSSEPYDPQISYERDDPAPPSNRVRWERVAVLGAVVLITFLLGRASAPDVLPEERLDAARDELDQAEDQIETLEDELRAQTQPTTGASPSPEPEATPTLGTGRVYVVQSGDTMRGIAETFCGDASLDDFIAAFNEIEDPSSLSVGMELRIPSDCDD